MQTFVRLAAAGTSAREAALILGCDPRTAKRGLEQAQRTLQTRHEDCLDAESLLRHAGVRSQDMPLDKKGKTMSRRSWDRVALGLRKAA